jgi:ADP-heptose:LPS heptosyltransferase
MLKGILRKLLPNPLDALLRRSVRADKRSFLIVWNRGLGDIPLGMYALIFRIKEFIPSAHVTVLTREDLREGFEMLRGIEVLSIPFWRRKKPIDVDIALGIYGKVTKDWDVVIESPDPTYWVRWQLGVLTPKLYWDPSGDDGCLDFNLDQTQDYLGVHLHSETVYGYEKNWPRGKFEEVFGKVYREYGKKVILFGSMSKDPVEVEGVIDLRGRTSLKQMISVIKNRCSHLLLPDSGILSITYYLDCPFKIHIVSLWADPFQGVLKQDVGSPNPLLTHTPLIAKNGDLSGVTVEDVLCALSLSRS